MKDSRNPNAWKNREIEGDSAGYVAAQDARAETRRIIAGLVQRVPAIDLPAETPPGAPGPPKTASGGGGETPRDRETPASEVRPWWRRWFK